MVSGPLWRVLRGLLLAVALVAVAVGSARAEESRRAGTVRLETISGGRGPIELRADPSGGAARSAELVIVNDGKEPLVVSRLAVRGDAADPRVPPRLSARIVGGSLPITIPPGASRKANVTWTPEPSARQRQLFGHIMVTTSDERSGEVAMGVRARRGGVLGALEAHVLSLLVGVPLLGALAMFAARAAGRRAERTPRRLAVVALGVQTLLAAYVARGFVPDVSRADGNDGLQFIEHAVWIRGLSAEVYLGVDGIAATSLLVTSLVALLAVVPERPSSVRSDGDGDGDGEGYYAGLLVLEAAVVGAIAAMDGLLFLFFSSIAVVSAALLVGTWGGPGRRAAAVRLAVPRLFALVLLAVALLAIARHADPTFLIDGTRVTTSFSLPELSRVALDAKGATFLGGALVKVCFVMVLAASLFFLAAFPSHKWLADVLVEAPPAAGILVATALPTIGLCAFLRVGCAVLPEGMRWASGIVVALGAIATGYGALAALGQSDLRRMAASATTTQAGFVLLGAGSLTPQGLSGAIVLGSTRALACGAFLLLVAAIRARARTSDVARLEGIPTHLPGWTTALAVAALAQAGVLGLGGAWGPLLALLGALSSYAPLAIAAAIASVILAAAHLSAITRIAFGSLDSDRNRRDRAPTKSAPRVPLGGGLSDLSGREWTSVAPLVLLVVLLGVWPLPLVSQATGTVRDLANAVSPPGPDQVASRG